MGTAIKHPVPDRVKPSLRHRMLYSCTHMATVGFKGLTNSVGTPTYHADISKPNITAVSCYSTFSLRGT